MALSPHEQPSADSHYHFQVAYDIAHGALVPDVARSVPALRPAFVSPVNGATLYALDEAAFEAGR